MLEERGRGWQERFPRLEADAGTQAHEPADEPIHELELWDLVSAFGRILRDRRSLTPASIVYDDTPIHVFMQRIHEQLLARGRLALGDLFQQGMHKSTLVGIFLAVLELVRHHGVRAEQEQDFGEIWILPGPDASPSLGFAAGEAS
jgi:segregation and condensation protein A